MINQRAFSLIELVVTMIIISILAVTVLPKFFGISDFSVYTVRDQLISQLKAAQLQALNQRGVCHNLLITDDYFGLVRNSGVTCGTAVNTGDRIDYADINIDVLNNSVRDFQFDPDGRVTNLTTDAGCLDCLTIKLTGSEVLFIVIESEGYIHAL